MYQDGIVHSVLLHDQSAQLFYAECLASAQQWSQWSSQYLCTAFPQSVKLD